MNIEILCILVSKIVCKNVLLQINTALKHLPINTTLKHFPPDVTKLIRKRRIMKAGRPTAGAKINDFSRMQRP